MQLIIDTYGIELSVSNNRLAMQKGETVKYLAPAKAVAIHIFTPCSLSSPVITWAALYEIPVLIYNNKGRVAARLWQAHFGSHAAIRIQQADFCRSAGARVWVKGLLLKKAFGQLRVLKSLAAELQLKGIEERIILLTEKIKSDAGINLVWMRSMEAICSRFYWTGIAFALRNQVKVLPRNLRPAKDRFNALLNYYNKHK